MTAAQAFEVSAVWANEEMARRVGRERMRQYLEQSRYGNGDLSQPETDFWNFGSFGITPINMVQFLRDLYEEKLPFSKRNNAFSVQASGSTRVMVAVRGAGSGRKKLVEL